MLRKNMRECHESVFDNLHQIYNSDDKKMESYAKNGIHIQALCLFGF